MIRHSGAYIVGKQLSPGNYILNCIDKKKSHEQDGSLVQILPSFGKNSLSGADDVKPGDAVSFAVEKGDILQIDKTITEESDNLTMFLQKVR